MAEREFDTLTTQRGSLAKLAEAISTKHSAYLTVTQGENQGRRLKLGDVPVTLGRSADCDFRLLNRAISRLHCRVWRDNSGFWVRDLNSTNKTYLNDRPVVEARLKDGDFITVGGTVVQFTQEQDVDHAAQSEFFDLVSHDQLTGLLNRTLLADRIRQAVICSARNHSYGALLLLDLDNFKALNDTQGHDIGDQFLIEVAARMESCIRECDTVARLGGDEFVVVIPNAPAYAPEALARFNRPRPKAQAGSLT